MAQASPSEAARQITSAAVGFWHFTCDGKGLSEVWELQKVAENTVRLARGLQRRHANADCSGGITAERAVQGGTANDDTTFLGGSILADGRIVTMASFTDNNGQLSSQQVTMSADKNQVIESGRSGPINRVSSLAFPASTGGGGSGHGATVSATLGTAPWVLNNDFTEHTMTVRDGGNGLRTLVIGGATCTLLPPTAAPAMATVQAPSGGGAHDVGLGYQLCVPGSSGGAWRAFT